MIYKGLNSEDADFLGMVSQKQAEIDERRFNQESEELVNFRVIVFIFCFHFCEWQNLINFKINNYN